MKRAALIVALAGALLAWSMSGGIASAQGHHGSGHHGHGHHSQGHYGHGHHGHHGHGYYGYGYYRPYGYPYGCYRPYYPYPYYGWSYGR